MRIGNIGVVALFFEQANGGDSKFFVIALLLCITQFIEQFKASSPLCVPVGLLMHDRQNSAVVRHTGLQLLEHAVK